MRGEDDLRSAMQVLAVDPPTVEDVIRVVRPSGKNRRRRVWILPVAAATVTLAVVLTVTALVSGAPTTHQFPQVRKPPVTPTAFVGVHWILLTVQRNGAAPTNGEASLLIRRDGQFTAGFRCGFWKGIFRSTVHGADFIDGAYIDHNCPYDSTNREADARTTRTVESVLDGAVQWSLRADRLTITKAGAGSLTYVPSEVSATISGRLLAVGGPAGVKARSLSGTVTVTAKGGTPLTVTVGSNGKYSITVAPGTYQVQGHSPAYQNGKRPCRALKPADASAGTVTTADVYCQER